MCSEETVPAGTELTRGHRFSKIRSLRGDCPQQAWLSWTWSRPEAALDYRVHWKCDRLLSRLARWLLLLGFLYAAVPLHACNAPAIRRILTIWFITKISLWFLGLAQAISQGGLPGAAPGHSPGQPSLFYFNISIQLSCNLISFLGGLQGAIQNQTSSSPPQGWCWLRAVGFGCHGLLCACRMSSSTLRPALPALRRCPDIEQSPIPCFRCPACRWERWAALVPLCHAGIKRNTENRFY